MLFSQMLYFVESCSDLNGKTHVWLLEFPSQLPHCISSLHVILIMSLLLPFDEIGLTFHMLTKEIDMNTDQMVDVPVQDAAWGHATASDADGLELHYVRWGQGPPFRTLLANVSNTGMVQ